MEWSQDSWLHSVDVVVSQTAQNLRGQDLDHGVGPARLLWGDPYAFRPERFLEHAVEREELIPQGGGEPRTGHRCPGEGLTIGLLEALAHRPACLEYTVLDQDLKISLRRIPARVRSGFAVRDVRVPSDRTLTTV